MKYNLLSKTIVTQNLPVTCVRRFRNVLMVAEGPCLVLFKIHSSTDVICAKKSLSIQLFPNNLAISGVELENDDNDNPKSLIKGFCWAGNVGKIYDLKVESTETEHLIDESSFIELIFDFTPVAAHWVNNGQCLLVLSMSNFLVVLECGTKSSKYLETKRYQCESLNLFCGSISGNGLDDLIIFSGTVFDGIIVWTIKREDDIVCVKQQTLRGHNVNNTLFITFENMACQLFTKFLILLIRAFHFLLIFIRRKGFC